MPGTITWLAMFQTALCKFVDMCGWILRWDVNSPYFHVQLVLSLRWRCLCECAQPCCTPAWPQLLQWCILRTLPWWQMGKITCESWFQFLYCIAPASLHCSVQYIKTMCHFYFLFWFWSPLALPDYTDFSLYRSQLKSKSFFHHV